MWFGVEDRRNNNSDMDYRFNGSITFQISSASTTAMPIYNSTLKTRDLKDDAGALYYVVAVVLIFGFSIILLIFSHVKNNRTDRYLMLHIKEMEKLRQQSKAFNTWPSNSYKRTEARSFKNRMPYSESDADFRVYPLDIVEEYSIDHSDEANKLTPLSSNSSHVDTVFEYLSIDEGKHLNDPVSFDKSGDPVNDRIVENTNSDYNNAACKDASLELANPNDPYIPTGSDKNDVQFGEVNNDNRETQPSHHSSSQTHFGSRSRSIPEHAMMTSVSKERSHERVAAWHIARHQRLSMNSRPVCHSVADEDDIIDPEINLVQKH